MWYIPSKCDFMGDVHGHFGTEIVKLTFFLVNSLVRTVTFSRLGDGFGLKWHFNVLRGSLNMDNDTIKCTL